MVLGTKLALSLAASASVIGTAALAAPVLEGGAKFSITLTGAAECHVINVCGVGDPNASGTADITINPGQRRVCWEITTAGINPEYTFLGAHIHRAPSNAPGPIVVHLDAALNDTDVGCATLTSPTGVPIPRALLVEMIRSPQDFYVNIHYRDDDPSDGTLTNFAAGGLRGQLDKAPLKSN